ncbi:hypothetical protein GOODEAATRI_004433 [Goodea atripinnis]|uniref:Uncharacterized protein n=1 Tax=Goodea atripinnis TaxID=208336 RepID=A0ABV0P1K9_9TELE
MSFYGLPFFWKESITVCWTTAMLTVPFLHECVDRIGEVAVDILHLERVSVTDLVVSAAVVGCLDHDDITPGTAEINGISFTRELSPDQPERQGRTAEA